MIVNALKSYNIEIVRIEATIGPTVTLYEIVPTEGTRIAKIKSLEDDIAMSLSATGIRIESILGRGGAYNKLRLAGSSLYFGRSCFFGSCCRRDVLDLAPQADIDQLGQDEGFSIDEPSEPFDRNTATSRPARITLTANAPNAPA